jgi:hypothetical protein
MMRVPSRRAAAGAALLWSVMMVIGILMASAGTASAQTRAECQKGCTDFWKPQLCDIFLDGSRSLKEIGCQGTDVKYCQEFIKNIFDRGTNSCPGIVSAIKQWCMNDCRSGGP